MGYIGKNIKRDKMAELNLQQISDKLNNEFAGKSGKRMFWYDDEAEFIEDIDSLKLDNVKILKLETNNQFFVKYQLERVAPECNYLIYAPFERPDIKYNHLEDIIIYSGEFKADRASIIMLDLGIDSKYKSIIQKHLKFFRAKDRTKKFYELRQEKYSKELIEVTMMSALCGIKTTSFEEVIRTVIAKGELENNKYLTEFSKYNLEHSFWELCLTYFGYAESEPNLITFIYTLFITHTQQHLKSDLPKRWQKYATKNSGSVIAFMDNLMNNSLYSERYNQLSKFVADKLDISSEFINYDTEALIDIYTFEAVDKILLIWLSERLLAEDIGASISGKSIVEICQYRRRLHFGSKYVAEYHLLESAYHIISESSYPTKNQITKSLSEIIEQYKINDYKIDQQYRNYYFNYDQISARHQMGNVWQSVQANFEKLSDLVEVIYTNKYLDTCINNWNRALSNENIQLLDKLQRNFFRDHIQYQKERVVVIISDAFRYEVGESLYMKLEQDEKCNPELDTMISVLPSFTRFGMGALLPHRSLQLTDECDVLVDGKLCDNLKQRENMLQSYQPNSRSIQYDDLTMMKRDELREVFTGMEVVYIYHNQIDARGDRLNTENEVFNACSEAVDEIFEIIKRISNSANSYNFIITADHGFIYKREKLVETEKISDLTRFADKNTSINRRYIVSDREISEEGVVSYKIGDILANDDMKFVSVPLTSLVFKVAGGSQNFVHGGSSPQEMIVPLIKVKVDRYFTETRPAKILLVSLITKITNLETVLEFIQSEAVSDVVKETSYKLYFVSSNNEKISNESIYIADNKSESSANRIFRLNFNFKNVEYDRTKPYYLVAYDEQNDIEIFRHEVMMDIPMY